MSSPATPRPLLRPSLVAAVAAAALLVSCKEAPSAPVIVNSSSPPAPRTISVSGTAEIKTAPDEFVVSVGVDSFAADALAAKNTNDQGMGALLSVITANKIDPKDVRTDHMTLTPRHEGSYDSRRLVGYDARKTLSVTVRAADKVEALLADLFKNGANRLDGVTFASSRILEQRREARTLAVAAAREKAQAMAATLGQKIGRPLKVEEERETPWSGPVLNNVAFNNDSRASIGETMATGKIQIRATVSVTFELAE